MRLLFELAVAPNRDGERQTAYMCKLHVPLLQIHFPRRTFGFWTDAFNETFVLKLQWRHVIKTSGRRRRNARLAYMCKLRAPLLLNHFLLSWCSRLLESFLYRAEGLLSWWDGWMCLLEKVRSLDRKCASHNCMPLCFMFNRRVLRRPYTRCVKFIFCSCGYTIAAKRKSWSLTSISDTAPYHLLSREGCKNCEFRLLEI